MKQYFEDLKQNYPNTAKALGVTADMTYEEFREMLNCKALQTLTRPLPVDTSGLTTPVPFPGAWYRLRQLPEGNV